MLALPLCKLVHKHLPGEEGRFDDDMLNLTIDSMNLCIGEIVDILKRVQDRTGDEDLSDQFKGL